MRVRLAAQGEVGPGGGPAGDLYVEVHEKPHDIFVRDGDDLHCTISVPMVDAALGTTVTVDAIMDGPTEITIPAGTQPGSVTTLRGHGMPHLRSGVRGDLHAHIDVVVPSRLDHQDTELLRKLKEHRTRDVRRGAVHPHVDGPAGCSAGCAKPSPAARHRHEPRAVLCRRAARGR